MTELFDRVAILEAAVPLEDDSPNVEGPSPAIFYDAKATFNYADRNAYDTHWAEETVIMQKLDGILVAGDAVINTVYTYRSCSKALPQVKTADQLNKNQIYEGTCEVLEPEITRLKDFMYFQRDTIKLFCDQIKRLAVPDKKKKESLQISETLVLYLIKMLDLFALLDALKNMKACLNNDYSFYKRAHGFIKKTGPTDDQTENHTFYLFLAHQNAITTNLRTELQNIDGFDEVLSLCANQCARYLEEDRYMLPIEKHCLLRVMPYVLYLMDGDDNKHNIFKNKNLNLSDFSRIFKKNPVVPLYGDMQTTLESLIKRSPHFDEKVWGVPAGANADVKLAQEYEIVNIVQQTRTLHNEYLSRFANMINELKFQTPGKTTTGPPSLTQTECKEVVTTVLQGLKLLSDWSSKVLQQSAWKYARPNNDPNIESQVDYERVVKYNYTSEDRFALIEFIAMIKGLSSVMMREESLLSPIIRRSIHDDLQEFVQITLREMIRSVSKNAKKKADLRTELLQLRAIAADWMGGTEPVDVALYGKKAEKEEKVTFPSRAVSPSPTQLDLIRNIVFGLIDKKKEWSSSQLKDLEDFYKQSFFFKYLLDIPGTIAATTDLADLWYREFYLELSKRLQFPIEMSLPWILTDHILESHDASMTEFLLYPLDIYNDAANRALNSLHQRFLYDEIEAEVNLCFDQLVFKLSEQVYTHFKIQASSILLDKPYKTQLELCYTTAKFHVPKSRYDVVIRQRHFQLLGRSIDLNNVISQRQNTYLRQNIDFAINRFEASDLTSVIELENQLTNIRMVHKLMSEHFQLDPFESILAEVNESTSLVSFHGRIVLHIIFELISDFFPNFNFNSITQRFIRAPFAFTADVPRDAMPKSNPMFAFGNKALNAAYANSSELYKKFIGMPHIHSILRLVDREGLPLMIGEILRSIDLKISNVLSPYVRELQGGMPKSSKLPIHEYLTAGCYGYYKAKLADIFTYPDLRPEVLHNFRQFGNAIVFMNLLDLGQVQLNSLRFVQTAPFLGVVPDEPKTDADLSAQSPLYAHLQRVAAFLESKPELAKYPPVLREIVANAWRADQIYRPSARNMSLFKSILPRIDTILNPVRAEWAGSAPENGVLSIDYTTEFYRLWSGLQFVVCMPTSENDAGPHELFGDGLMWAGCTIMHFLGQQRRFDLFDFCYHILNVEEGSSVPCTEPTMRVFFRNVSLAKDLNNTIFSILNTYTPVPILPFATLHPPTSESLEQVFLTADQQQQQKTPVLSSAPPAPMDSYAPPSIDASADSYDYSEESTGDEFLPPPPPPPIDM